MNYYFVDFVRITLQKKIKIHLKSFISHCHFFYYQRFLFYQNFFRNYTTFKNPDFNVLFNYQHSSELIKIRHPIYINLSSFSFVPYYIFTKPQKLVTITL